MHRIRILISGLVLLSSSLFANDLPINTKLGGDFSLPSTLGKDTGIQAFKGKVVLLNFGFTHCPDVCPMVLNRMAQVMGAKAKFAETVVPVFITVDPERDTVAHLAEYLRFFHPGFVGFGGTQEALQAVAKQYGVVVIPSQSKSGSGVNFTHSDFIYLLDQNGRVRALYSQKDSIESIVNDVESLARK